MPVNRLTPVQPSTTGAQQPQPLYEILMPQSTSTNVPAFLAKLWKMVENPETDLLICWADSGNSFIIRNQAEFSRDLLPYYYKHSNMASFIRQLNMYGFHKVVSVDSGGLKSDRDEIEFAHPFFLRGQDHLLPEIKRKVSSNLQVARQAAGPGGDGTGGGGGFSGGGGNLPPNIKSDKVTEVLTEVSMLKDRQEDTDCKLDTMRKENEALWQEVLNLRQKHSQQQKIVNKLIHFLMAVVQPRMTSSLKRRYAPAGVPQLAIDSPSFKAKEPKLDPKAGPTIQDVTHAMSEPDDPLMSLLQGEGGAVRTGLPSDIYSVGAGQTTPPLSTYSGSSIANSPRVEMPQTPRPAEVTIDSPPPTILASGGAPMFSSTSSSTIIGGSSNKLTASSGSSSANRLAVSPSGSSNNQQDKYRLVNPASVNTAIVQGPLINSIMGSTSQGASSNALQNSSNQAPSNQTQKSSDNSKPQRPALNREISKEDFDLDITNMQAELDNLKDILSGQITLDSSLVSSLFSPEETHPNLGGFNYGSTLPNNITINAEGLDDLEQDDLKSLSYNPSLFELTAEDEEPESLLPVLTTGSRTMPPPPPSTSTITVSPIVTTTTPLNTASPIVISPPDSTLNTPLIQDDNINPLTLSKF
eukprot:TRINITY_DN17895_c0_g1_i13.p1 TRINITY_DN17895_c0_g1~~TRINITY_DN17895_c0_g1_i13.p1  ORF type:complete len:657 (-),score=138.39 TRINITY_DN17895_c0_g1_i13:388-2304(-)